MAKTALSPVADEILNRTKAGLDEHTQIRRYRYDNAYQVYRAQYPFSGESWQSKLRIPYGQQVIDTALVNIVSGKPRAVVRPRAPQFEEAAKAMQHTLDYFVQKDHFVEKQPPFAQSALIFGAAVAKNHWMTRVCERNVRETVDVFGSQIRSSKKVKYVDYDGPTFEPWDIYNTFWDPDARDVDSAAYWVLVSYLSKEQLEQMRINPNAGTGTLHNLDALYEAGYRRPDAPASQRGNDTKNKDKFEVWEVWRDTPSGLKLTVLGNRQIVLRDDQSPYWHGSKPIVFAKTRTDLLEMAGIPETDLVDHLQQALHTVSNMRMDNWKLTVMRGITYREGGVTDPNALELRPRFKWPVTDHDDIRPFEVQPLPPEAYNEEEALLSRMQLVTGINPYISGADSSQVDQNTATGITALQEVASRLLRFKAGQLQNAYQRTYEQWADMIQQLLDTDIAVKIVANGKEEWRQYAPEDVVGDYDVVVEGTEESLSRQQERGEAVQLLNAFAPLAATGMVNMKPILERVAAAYNIANPESLLQAPPQQSAAPMGASTGAPPDQTLVNGGQMAPQALNAIQGVR